MMTTDSTMLHPNMNQEVFRKVHPHEYLRRFLSENVRPDGRAPFTSRKISITTGSVGTAVGSALLKLGHTTVVAGVHATLTQPSVATKDQGFLETSVELLSLASGNYKAGRSSDEATCLTEYLRSIIAPRIPLAQLCVEEEHLVWYLRLTVYVMDHDGNLEDAVLLAAVAALKNVQLPEVEMLDEEENGMDVEAGKDANADAKENSIAVAVASSERTITLQNNGFPLSVSFALFDGNPLIDPSVEEESICNCRITFLLDASGELHGVLKPGGSTISEEVYETCLAHAKRRVPIIMAELKET